LAYSLAHNPEKLVLDLIGDGNRFSEMIMHNRFKIMGELAAQVRVVTMEQQ